MMTWITSVSIIIITTLMVSNSPNPAKISMILVLMSASVFTNVKMYGESWMPTLYFLVFMGGILMMFMILSSILPNEKDRGEKILKESIILVTILGMTMLPASSGAMANGMKSFISSSQAFMFFTILILTYFFLSVSIVSEEGTSLRSIICHKSE